MAIAVDDRDDSEDYAAQSPPPLPPIKRFTLTVLKDSLRLTARRLLFKASQSWAIYAAEIAAMVDWKPCFTG